MSVVTLPLKYEPWQRDVMNKRFELCRNVYNAMLGYEIKQFGKMQRDPRYKEIAPVIESAYKGAERDSDGKAKIKITPELKEAFDKKNAIEQEYGLTEFGFTSSVRMFYKEKIDFTQNISSNLAILSIAKPMWAAFSAVMYRGGEQVSFKKYGELNSVATDGKSGMRLIDRHEDTLFSRVNNEPVSICYGTAKGKILTMPVVLDKNDVYAQEALTHPIKVIRLVRKKVKGEYRYSVQFTVAGAPPIKYTKDGKEKHPMGSGRVGVYIDTTSVTAVNQDGTHVFSLKEGLSDHSKEISEIEQYLDISRRLSNPDNYNADGTSVKNGIVVDGKRVRLKWKYSNKYKKARAKKENLYRIDSENRSIQRDIIANRLMALGDEFYINDYPFQYAAQRKKDTQIDKNGRQKSKKKAGRTIGQLAPAAVVVKLESRLKARGVAGITKVKLKDIDLSMPNYREEYAKQLFNT